MQAPGSMRIPVTVDLVFVRWIPIAIIPREGRRDHLYRYGVPPQHCYLICLGLRDNNLLGQVAEVSLEHDEGGPVVTIYRLLPQREGEGQPTKLSRLLWPGVPSELLRARDV